MLETEIKREQEGDGEKQKNKRSKPAAHLAPSL